MSQTEQPTAPRTLTAAEESAIKERHRPVLIPGEPFTWVKDVDGHRAGEKGRHPDRHECSWCELDWPCDAARLLLSLAAIEAAASVPAPEQEEAVPPWDHPYESRGESMACIHCGWVGSYAHTAEFYQKWVFPALATPPPAPAAPAALWRLQGEYVVDRDGLVWRVVRDGGMATRADFTGIESIGIEALRSTKGPLTSLNDFVDAAAGAIPAAPPLDVERLAAALDVLSEDGLEYDLMAPEEREDRDDAAERLAAEYDRLSPVQEEVST